MTSRNHSNTSTDKRLLKLVYSSALNWLSRIPYEIAWSSLCCDTDCTNWLVCFVPLNFLPTHFPEHLSDAQALFCIISVTVVKHLVDSTLKKYRFSVGKHLWSTWRHQHRGIETPPPTSGGGEIEWCSHTSTQLKCPQQSSPCISYGVTYK